MKTLLHDPHAKLGYTVDWSDWLLNSDTISTSSWTVPTGLTKGTESKTNTTASVIVIGGTAKTNYVVTNHIITASGLEDDRSFILKVVDR